MRDWEIAEEMGVTNYGQMTAGGWMYIGPQGSFTVPSTPFSMLDVLNSVLLMTAT